METYIGFDSAWTDNPKAPGALCAIRFDNDGAVDFYAPRPTSFDQALAFIRQLHAESAVTIIALDQPTLVPNLTGMRPVERVAASLMSWLGGGVQPANRGRLGMFCNASPVWRFLASLGATEDPEVARTAYAGLFLMEVFPALALASLDIAFFGRLKAPKYNPARRNTFKANDWVRVGQAAAKEADALGCHALAEWCHAITVNLQPKKADQDLLDSALCLLTAIRWRRQPRDKSVLLGDLLNGYMVLPASGAVSDKFTSAARKHAVPIDGIIPSSVSTGSKVNDLSRFVADASSIRMLGRILRSKSEIEQGFYSEGPDYLGDIELYNENKLMRVAILHLRKSGNNPTSLVALRVCLESAVPGVDVVVRTLRALENGGAYFEYHANKGSEEASITLNLMT
jgi:predicted RNase H-like nuclease